MKKLLYIAPLALTLILSSCGSKDGDKKEEGDGKKKAETGCDCMEIMVAEIKKLDDISKMGELESRLNKEYPNCKKLVNEFSEEEAKDCPAMNELRQLILSMEPEQSMPSDTLENVEEMEEYEEELEGNE
jgi:hypothetical protein